MQPIINSLTEKFCPKCKTVKPFSDFPKGGKTRRFGIGGHCKACIKAKHRERYDNDPQYKERVLANQRKHNARRYKENRQKEGQVEKDRENCRRFSRRVLYGVTPEIFAGMLNSQQGLCAICRNPPRQKTMHDHTLHIDHDHQTGKVRGLLCFQCNTGLGKFGDNPQLLQVAIGYLFRASV